MDRRSTSEKALNFQFSHLKSVLHFANFGNSQPQKFFVSKSRYKTCFSFLQAHRPGRKQA